jgi:hypothetical protein
MLWLIQNILFSVCLIVIIHYLYIYFKTTLTTPKVKDLIHCPKKKYESLFNTIQMAREENEKQNGIGLIPSRTNHYRNPESQHQHQQHQQHQQQSLGIPTTHFNHEHTTHTDSSESNMKSELKAYLKNLGLQSQS